MVGYAESQNQPFCLSLLYFPSFLKRKDNVKRKKRKHIYLTLMFVDLITVLIVSALTDMPYSIEKYFGILFTILLTLYCLVPSDKKDNNNH